MKAKQLIIEVYGIWVSERPNQLAAALAYFGMFSFAPIIFVTVSIAGFFVKEINMANQFYQRIENLLGAEISVFIQDAVSALSSVPSSSSVVISIISFLALLYAASGLFFQLQFSLNTIWRLPPPQKGQTASFIRQRLFSFLIVIGVGLLGILAAFASVLATWFRSVLESLLGIGGSQVLAVSLVIPIIIYLIIALFYRILPETKIAWRDVWVGAAVSSVLILAAVLLAGLFLQHSTISSALQATGAFTILLVGFYYIAQIFLLGAVVCRVYAGLFGSRRIEQKTDA